MCLPIWVYELPCKVPEMKGVPPTPTGRLGGQGCPCKDVTNGKTTTGICISANKCQGKTTAEGKGVGLGQVGDIMKGLGPLMQQLQGMMKGGGGGGSGGGQGGGQGGGMGGLGSQIPGLGSNWDTNMCYGQRYDSTVPTTDPCATYKPATSNDLLNSLNTNRNTSGSLLDALNGSNSSANSQQSADNAGGSDQPPQSVSSQLQQNAPASSVSGGSSADTGSAGQAGSGQQAASSSPFAGSSVGGLAQVPPGGARGDITTDAAGLTVTAGTRDTQANTEIAGFFGADTGDQSASVVGSWCTNRPWATNFLGKIVPPAFFDSLCKWRGYTVGPQAPADSSNTGAMRPAVELQQQTGKGPIPKKTAASSTAPVAEGKVQIWAVPAKVSLGARTSVFWNTQNVTSCTETSPDGSFNQTSLSGGASTVPLTGPTTFTISCLDMTGKPVTGFVTVEIKI